LTGTCYNFEMKEFFSSFLRRAGMPASAGLSCFVFASLAHLGRFDVSEIQKFSILGEQSTSEVIIFEVIDRGVSCYRIR